MIEFLRRIFHLVHLCISSFSFCHHLLLASFPSSAPCLFASVSSILNTSSHFSFTPVLSPPALHLCLTPLCPLFLRPVCHVITSPQRHITWPWLSLLFFRTLSTFLFFFPPHLYTDPSHKAARNGATQRLLNGQ